jgi:hypothetical protein
MSTIMIKCPDTGAVVSTGVETDPTSFARILPNLVSRSKCPLCGAEHSWRKRDAWLGDYGDDMPPPVTGRSGTMGGEAR